MPKVVHCKKAPTGTFVYVGRPTKWGNKFTHRKYTKAEFIVGSREEAVNAYEDWLMKPEQDCLRDSIRTELKGKDLGCWCAPKLCHASILLKVANKEEVNE